MKDLTHLEAQQRAALISNCRYEVFLDFTCGDETFRSRTRLTFNAQAGQDTFLDAWADQIEQVQLNGRALDPAEVFDGKRITLPQLAAENEVVIEGLFAYTNTGEGMHRFIDPADGEVYLYTQFEVPDSRRVYAVFEQPDIKAIFTFSTKGPAHWKVISNSICKSVAEDGSYQLREFMPTPKMSSYLTAIVAGPYHEVRSELTSASGRTIPLGLYCRSSMAEYLDSEYLFDITRKGFTFYEKNFAYPYPFEKYDQIFVPEYNMGAMENIGCVTFNENYVFRGRADNAVRERRVVTILHELAHMWFGNLVTMRWWNDLWLNESFAEWASTIATAEVSEWEGAWATFASAEKNWAYRDDQLPTTHPIVAQIDELPDVYNNFDGITYAKGASVLKQLVHWVGLDNFYRGLGQYFQKHAYSNTVLTDLLAELSDTSGRDLQAWSKQWLETTGVNTLSADFKLSDGKFTEFAIEQSADKANLRDHRIAIGLYTLVGDRLQRQQQIDVDISGQRSEVAQLVGVQQPDLLLINDDDHSYCTITLDIKSLDCALEHLSKLEDPLARAVIWGALWAGVNNSTIAPALFIEAVLKHVGSETDTTLKWVLEQLDICLRFYSNDYQPARAKAAEKIWSLFKAAPNDSDKQLQLLRSYALFAITKEQYERLHKPDDLGITLDTDIEWWLLTGRAAGAAVSEEQIAEFAAKDSTMTGRELAARTRAALPTSKRQTWESVFNDTSLSNSMIRNLAAGFRRTNSADELEEFVDEYFAQIRPLFEQRTFSIGSLVAKAMFPAESASEELIAKTKAWLEENSQAPAGLRRIIRENLYAVEKAVKIKQYFA